MLYRQGISPCVAYKMSSGLLRSEDNYNTTNNLYKICNNRKIITDPLN